MSGSRMFENFLFSYNMTFIRFTKVCDRVHSLGIYHVPEGKLQKWILIILSSLKVLNRL